MKLNEAQSKAVSHVDGPMMVIAGPGSGKTTVITKRIKYLIESAGVSPADILVITFTRAAAGEMQQRFRAMTPGKEYPVRFGTFHSIFYWILKTAYGQSMLRVISEEEKRGIDRADFTYDGAELREQGRDCKQYCFTGKPCQMRHDGCGKLLQ